MSNLLRLNLRAGLTETCAGTFVSLPNEMPMLGTVGPPVPNVDVCLESVPEMGYDALAEVPRGEVCVRGSTLFSGYYKREDLTREVMVDGWFHTGFLDWLFPFLYWYWFLVVIATSLVHLCIRWCWWVAARWKLENYWPQKEYFQAITRRICCSWELGEHLWSCFWHWLGTSILFLLVYF